MVNHKRIKHTPQYVGTDFKLPEGVPIQTIPYKYTPRDYQKGPFMALEQGIKRGICIWHRRAGKDKTFLNMMIKEMMNRVGLYYYFFPTYSQGRKILWEGIGGDEFKFLDHFPAGLVASKDNQEMKIELTNGSIFRIIGIDNIDTIVGTNPVGCIFSEFSLQDPKGWDYISPILAENNGWAFFNFTPRGKNHAYNLYKAALTDPDWFVSVLTVDDTNAIKQTVLDKERNLCIAKHGDDAFFRQEYHCAFEGSLTGSFYGHIMQALEKENRIVDALPYDPMYPVDTWWDIGVNDSTCIWFTQKIGRDVFIIDYYENSNQGIQFYARILQEKRYAYGRHGMPHDVKVAEWGSNGVSRLSIARRLLGPNVFPVEKLGIEDGIEAVRNLLPRCIFSRMHCQKGIDALYAYRKEYDDRLQTYKSKPVHDWSSHAADAFRYLAVATKDSYSGDSNPVLSQYNAKGRVHRNNPFNRKDYFKPQKDLSRNIGNRFQ